MTKLCIKKFEQESKKPLTTVSIPLAVIKMVKSLIPKKAKEELQKEGIDIHEIIKLSKSPDFTGTVLEVFFYAVHIHFSCYFSRLFQKSLLNLQTRDFLLKIVSKSAIPFDIIGGFFSLPEIFDTLHHSKIRI